MGRLEFDAYIYSCTVAIVFGILGNVLVILSILRQRKNVLKNNYYFFVLHLAICDLAVLILCLSFYSAEFFWLKKPLSDHSLMIICYVYAIGDAFQVPGVGMMLIISLLRYRATVHPLKPAISRRKLKVVCGLVYLIGLIGGGGTSLPACLIKSNVVLDAHLKYFYAFWILFVYFVPTIFMALVYHKIARALIKQNKHMKRICSNPMRQRELDSSLNMLRYIRNRRTFLVCLSTVLCYGIACIPISMWFMWLLVGDNHLQMRYVWVRYFADVLKVAGSFSANPLIYGMLDKKLLTFWKCCCKKKRRT